MAYATAEDFDRFGIRSSALPGSITPDDKLAAIRAASGRADSYLGARFRLPLILWGVDLTQAVCAIAAFELMAVQVGFNPEAGHNLVLMQRKDDAFRWLQEVSRGHCAPAGVSDSSPAATAVPRVYSNPQRGW